MSAFKNAGIFRSLKLVSVQRKRTIAIGDTLVNALKEFKKEQEDKEDKT